ncbi:MAG: hypothetical protein C0518_14735 [Opitutus sp.]|nr:hypothetical protein [Opitutus sp.]
MAKLVCMKPEPIKEVGVVRRTAWERFVRLQATAALLAQKKGQPKGVFRFRSHEECDQWTRKRIGS